MNSTRLLLVLRHLEAGTVHLPATISHVPTSGVVRLPYQLLEVAHLRVHDVTLQREEEVVRVWHVDAHPAVDDNALVGPAHGRSARTL